MAHVAVAGGVSWDTLLHLPEFPPPEPATVSAHRSYQAVGGTGAGKALNLATLGLRVTLTASVGEDVHAEAIAGLLVKHGVRWQPVTVGEATEQHVNLMNARCERLSIYAVPPAPDLGFTSTDWREFWAAADVLVPSILDQVRPGLPSAMASGKPVWVDLHDYDGENPYHQAFRDAATHVFFSSENCRDPSGLIQTLLDEGKVLVVCTHGARGAEAHTAEGEQVFQPAEPVTQVVDTNGAGDAFFAGFLAAHLDGQPLAACMERGARQAALCVQSEALVG